MSDQYTFTWTSSSKPSFTVLPQTTDTSDTSLTLTGRGSANWGQQLQENLLWLLENFADSTAPAVPTTGQLWYDTTTQSLMVYNAANIDTSNGPWAECGGGVSTGTTEPSPGTVGQLWYNTSNGVLSIYDGTKWDQVYPSTTSVNVAYVTEYNAMAALINQIIGSPVGSTLATAFGWGQTGAVIPNATVGNLTNTMWLSLIAQINSICTYLGLSTTNVSPYGFMYQPGNVIPIGIVTMLTQYANTLTVVNSFSAGTTRFKPVSGSLESETPSAGTQTYSSTWNGPLVHDISVTWANQAAMNAFFNAGGQIQFIPSLTSPLTGRDFDVQAFLAARGTVTFSVTGTVDSASDTGSIGLYNLTTTSQQIFTFSGSSGDPDGQDTYSINAYLVGTDQINFVINYGSAGTLYGGVGGTLHSVTSVVRPLHTILDNPVIAWPTVTSSAITT